MTRKLIFIFCAQMFLCITAIAQERLTAETMWKFGRVGDIQLSPDGKIVLYGTTNYNLEANTGNRDLYVIPLAGGDAVKLTNFTGSEYNGRWRPDGKKIAFISAEKGTPQIWEMDPDGNSKMQISNVEGGVNGFIYSPDGKSLLYIKDVKLDKTVNEIYPDLPKADALIIDELFYRHWDSWTDFSFSHIFLASYQNGILAEGTDIMPGERFDSPLNSNGGMEQICWSPDGKKIAYTCRKLSGTAEALSTNSDIYLYDITTGKTVNISEPNPGYDTDPVFSPNGKKIAWCSMKTPGYESDRKRLMVLDIGTKTPIDLTYQWAESVESLRWTAASPDEIFFISGKNATYQVYSASLKTKRLTMVTNGTHDFTELATNGKVFIGVRMSMSMPPEIYKIDRWNQEKQTQITFTNKAYLDNIQMGAVESRWLTTTDGKQMLVWVIYPPFFDKSKKYPALLYCQGGPQSAVSQFWSYRWNFQMMAAHDYIVVAPNRRGLPTFGMDWNQQISGDYGGQNMQDYLTAIDSLATEPYIDKERLGSIGASYGGYSVYWLAGNHQKRFKAFIAHCGMFNFESWYASTEEYWFPDTDIGGAYWQENRPKSYDFSPHNFVGKWDTPILVIHGGNDFRIPYTEGMQAFNAAQLQGIPSRFLFFPNESHFVTKPQNSVLWQRVFFEWLDKYLK